MQITTKTFEVAPEALARMMRRTFFKRYRWVYLWLLVACGGCLGLGLWLEDAFMIFLGAGGLAFPLYRYIFFARYTKDPQNAPLLQRRRYVITPSLIQCWTEDGSETKTRLESLLRADSSDGIYRLYLTKHQYYFIPETAFETEADRRAFSAILRHHNLLEDQEGL